MAYHFAGEVGSVVGGGVMCLMRGVVFAEKVEEVTCIWWIDLKKMRFGSDCYSCSGWQGYGNFGSNLQYVWNYSAFSTREM